MSLDKAREKMGTSLGQDTGIGGNQDNTKIPKNNKFVGINCCDYRVLFMYRNMFYIY